MTIPGDNVVITTTSLITGPSDLPQTNTVNIVILSPNIRDRPVSFLFVN